MIEALRDVSIGARTLKRDQVPEDVVGRRGVPVRPGLDVHHRPDDGHRRRPVLPLRLTLTEHADGASADGPNRVVYDIAAGEARTEGRVDGRVARVGAHRGRARRRAAVGRGRARPVDRVADALRPRRLRAGRHRLPPHPSRARASATCCSGAITIDSEGAEHTYGPGEPWFERGPDPVLATTAADEPSAFVRVMLLPVEWEGQRTIRYVDPADADKPKTQQRDDLPRAAGGAVTRSGGQVLVDQLVAARHRPRVRRAGRELPRGARRAARRAAAADRHPPRGRRGEHGRGLRQADRPAGRLPGHARAGRDARAPTACTRRSRTRRRCCC